MIASKPTIRSFLGTDTTPTEPYSCTTDSPSKAINTNTTGFLSVWLAFFANSLMCWIEWWTNTSLWMLSLNCTIIDWISIWSFSSDWAIGLFMARNQLRSCSEWAILPDRSRSSSRSSKCLRERQRNTRGTTTWQTLSSTITNILLRCTTCRNWSF